MTLALQSDDQQTPSVSFKPWLQSVRIAIFMAFFVAILVYVVMSWRWPLVWDMQVIHYVSFLIDHGWAPYRQIGDMNMPGAYLVEGWALHLFGSSDLGWRLYDFCLSGTLIAAMVYIARPYDWLAGFVAGATFVVVHASEGAVNAGQRDQVIAVLLMAGTALCFAAVRRHIPALMLFFGMAVVLAGAIKPTMLLFGPIVLLSAVLRLRQQGTRILSYVAWAAVGSAIVIAIVLRFLLMYHCIHAFLYDITQVLPQYALFKPAPWSVLLRTTLQAPLFLYLFFAIGIVLLERRTRVSQAGNLVKWEDHVLLVGILFGLFNYYSQRKGVSQHRYTTMVFVLLWASIQIFHALRGQRRPATWLAYAALVLITVVNIPRNLILAKQQRPYDNFSAYLTRDLQHMGTAQLQGQVQCLDVIDGCLNALYHAKIIQNTGSTGDLLLFLPQQTSTVKWARDNFWNQIQTNPPAVFVLSNFVYREPNTFHKIDAWPAFANYLSNNYDLVLQRDFGTDPPTLGHRSNVLYPAYRIYVRHGSPLRP